MTAAPRWEQVDGSTGTLLDLLADDGSTSPSKAEEWDLYVACLREAASFSSSYQSVINPNTLRTVIAGRIKPQRVGAFTHRALSEGLVEYTGNYVISTDRAGRNSGKPAREMRWLGEPAKCTACHGRGSRVHGHAICAAECRDCGGTGESA